MMNKSYKAGIFVAVSLVLLFLMILRVSQGRFFFGNSYTVHVEVTSAVGLAKNTPVQIAGVDIGTVSDVKLAGSNRARLALAIDKSVQLSRDAAVSIRTTGILGDSYIEINQQEPITDFLKDGDSIRSVEAGSGIASMTGQFSDIAHDVKAVTAQMKKLMAGDDSVFERTMVNLEKITSSVSRLAQKNEQSINAIVNNLNAMSRSMNYLIARNTGRVDQSLAHITAMTAGIHNGQGTVGRLLKDDSTVEKINETLDGIKDAVSGFNRFQFELDAHTEFLAGTGSFKNYVSVQLQPRPDKFFLFEAVSDPDPTFETTIEETTVESGGSSSTVTTTRRSKDLNKFLFSAQIAKKFRDFTIRGGVIESSGGVGIDYTKGPFEFQFSAFDFKTDFNQRPHLKFLASAQITNTFYLLGGVDDFINRDQDLDWFVGAGFRFTDNDIKSLIGLAAMGGP